MKEHSKVLRRYLVIGMAVFVALIFMAEAASLSIGNGNSGSNPALGIGLSSSTAKTDYATGSLQLYTPMQPTNYFSSAPSSGASPAVAASEIHGLSGPTPSSSDGSGDYILAQIGNPDYFNPYLASTVCDFYALDLVYNEPTTTLLNGTIVPCLATSYTNLTPLHGITTFDPLTGANVSVKDMAVVHIRPGVQWDDWNATNAASTYVFSNSVSFTNNTGVAFSHTYKTVYNLTSGKNQSLGPITMQTHYVQAADFILSWKILSSSTLYSGSYSNVVNMLPLNNLTVEYFLSGPSGTFVPYTLETPILPYHVWVYHDYASNGSGLWNATTSSSTAYNAQSYNTWDLNYSATTGTFSNFVGTGPFMFNGGYGQPKGKFFHADCWTAYRNPNYFVRNITGNFSWFSVCAPSLHQITVDIYSSPSAAVGALQTGKADAIENNVPSSFLPTLETIPNVKIYEKPSTGYAYFKFSSYSQNAPFNITAFRQALRMASPLGYIDSAICDGFLTPGYSTIPTIDSPYHTSVPTYSFNLKAANDTIASIPGMQYKGGEWYYNGKQVTALIQSPSASLIPQIYTGYSLIASDWSKIGISSSVSSESFATIISKLDAYSNSDPVPYSVITLGVSGYLGDPVGDLIVSFNYTQSQGTGDYQGPFSAMNITTPFSSELGLPTGYHSGKFIDGLMANLSTYANTNSSVLDVRYAIDVMQYLEDEESTMMPIGYGPTDIIAYSNVSFTGVTHFASDMNGFWFHNEMFLHKRTTNLTVTKASAHAVVSAVSSNIFYTNGQYGNVTFTVTNNVTGKPIQADVSVSPTPEFLNVTNYTGVTNSAGQFKFEFQVAPTNYILYNSGYSGLATISAVAVPTNSSISGNSGGASFNVDPQPVAYKTTNLSSLVAGGSPQYYNITIYNPQTGSPVSGYAYMVQTMSAALNLYPTSSAQQETNLSTYDALCNSYSMLVPTAKNVTSDQITSISGVTGSNGVISVMLSVNSSFNFTLNGNDYQSYVFLGDFALAAPVGGENGYAVIGEETSCYNVNGYGTGEPVELPMMVEHSSSSYAISETTHSVNSTVTEVIVKVTNSGSPVSGYTLVLTSQNALGANRGYFVNSSSSVANPNHNLTMTCGADTGSAYLPSITLTTGSNGLAYANFSSGFYTYNSTTGAISPLPYNTSAVAPYDLFQISIVGYKPVTTTSTNYTDYYVIGGVVAAVVVIGAAVGFVMRGKKKKTA